MKDKNLFQSILNKIVPRDPNLSDFSDSLLENLPLMVFVKDAIELKFIRFNKAGEEILGYGRNDLLGKNDYDFFPTEQAEHFIKFDREVLAGKTIVDIPEEFIHTKSRGMRILHTKKIPLFDENGKAIYLLGISEDITDKKDSELRNLEIIREQAILDEREIITKREAFLAEITNTLASSLDYQITLHELAKLAVKGLGDWCTITMLEPSGKFVRAGAEHRDPSKKELINTFNNSFPPDIRAINAVKNGTFYNENIKDEELKAMAINTLHLQLMQELGSKSSIIVPITGRDHILGSISFISGSRSFNQHDITLAEEIGRRAGTSIENALLYSSAQSAIRSRDEFMSIASHELKTPITSLKMQLQMLQRQIDLAGNRTIEPQKLLTSLINSNNQINRLTILIEDLLDVTRIETGKLNYKFEEVNLSALVIDVIERFKEQIIFSKCELKIDITPNIHIFCDQFRIEQVVTNIISNAIKYGPGLPIEISVHKEGSDKIIQITDYGIGIPKEMSSKIFERFERAGSRTNVSGLGLGLYISKQIVDAHSGKIEVDSKLDVGTTFRVCLR